MSLNTLSFAVSETGMGRYYLNGVPVQAVTRCFVDTTPGEFTRVTLEFIAAVNDDVPCYEASDIAPCDSDDSARAAE